MVDQQQFQEVKQRVQQISGFYQHLTAYVLINTGLAAINWIANPHEIWFIYPLIGWGFGVAAHCLNVFVAQGRLKSWEEKKIREWLEKESRSN